MAVLVFLVLLLSLTGHSSATYCLCKDGVGDQSLQKSIDYACGNGADCTPILQNGPCYQPNTVKDHCNYAVNSYYQRKSQATGSCDFSGTATVSSNPPTTAASGCVYPSSSSNNNGTGTPTTTPTTNGSTTGGGTTPTPSVFELGPTGSGTGITDPNSATTRISASHSHLFYISLTLWISALFLMWG